MELFFLKILTFCLFLWLLKSYTCSQQQPIFSTTQFSLPLRSIYNLPSANIETQATHRNDWVALKNGKHNDNMSVLVKSSHQSYVKSVNSFFISSKLFCSTKLWTSMLWICEIQCIAPDGFDLDLNTVHWLCSKDNYLEKKSQQSQDSNPGLLGGKWECFLCATQPPYFIWT